MAKIVPQPESKILVPDWLVKAIGLAGSLSGEIPNKKPLLTYPVARLFCIRQFVSSDAALEQLQLPQTDIDIAIKECYDWFIENEYLVKK